MKRFFKLLLKTGLVLFVLLNIITIFQAYKLTHFYDKGQVTVIPQDKKTSWDKTKEIVFGFNTLKKQNVAPDTAYSTIYLTTKDSLKLQACIIPVANSKGTIILFHGHAGNKTDVIKEAKEFNRLGYTTFLLDFRAHGDSQGNTCTIGYDESEDVKLAYDYVQKSGEKNIVLWGISLGAATITKSIHDYGLQPSKVILEMPFGSLPDAVQGRIRMMHLPPQPLSSLLTFWGGTLHGFWAFGMKPSLYAKDIKCPVLLQWGRNDPRVTLAETEEIFANIGSPKKLVIYENSGHESLCKKENTKWITTVTDFVK